MRVSSNIYNCTNESNCMHEEIKRRLYSEIQGIPAALRSRIVCLLPKNIRINVKLYKNIVLPVAG
jgi:hypothetical protein